LDLKGKWVLPGLWNNHAHLSDLVPDPKNVLENEPLGSAAIRCLRNAMDGLRAGFTGVRVLGERDYLDVNLRDAFNAGVFIGPRLFACGTLITATGGHCWEPKGPGSMQVDGPFEIRKAVRENLKHNVDWIKIVDTELLPDEILAAVEVAHHRGVRVCAHSGYDSTKVSIRSGVDCIEHAYGLDDETVELMVKHKVFYVPTLNIQLDEKAIKEREQRLSELGNLPDSRTVKSRMEISTNEGRSSEFAKIQREGFRKALEAGVKICPAGDSNPMEEFGYLDIEQMVLYGMTEMQALISATLTSAELNGVADHLGTIQEEKLADLIVVSGNPLENISNIRKVEMVVKDGNMVNMNQQEGVTDFWDLFYFR
jgi:imidazolonepropionase-like amidohydrolase